MPKKKQKKAVTIYCRSTLSRILWRGVTDCFVICVATAVVLVGIILFFNKDKFNEYFPIAVGIFVLLLIAIVIYPMLKSYFFVKHQEQVTGRKYCKCTDFNLSPENREWFIACMSNFRGSRSITIHF